MNRTIIFAGIGALLVVGVAVWWLWPRASAPMPTGQDTVPLSPGSYTVPLTETEQEIQKGVRTTFEAVVKGHPDHIVLGKTIVVGEWALQLWLGDVMGGEALMHHDEKGVWAMIEFGGGSWSAEGLVEIGVPPEVATALIAGRGY